MFSVLLAITLLLEGSPAKRTLADRIAAVLPDAEQELFAVTEVSSAESGRVYALASNTHPPFVITLRVIEEDADGSFTILKTLHSDEMFGNSVDVRTIDLESDGRRELVVSAATGGSANRNYWIYRWDGADLSDISPAVSTEVPEGGALTEASADFFDLDADGTLEYVVTLADGEGEPAGLQVYRLEGGVLRPGERLEALELFVRTKSKPVNSKRTIGVAATDTPYTINIVDPSGTSSAVVSLNGVTLARPSDFRNRPQTITRQPVQLLPSNTLEVEMRGAPQSRLLVTVVKKAD